MGRDAGSKALPGTLPPEALAQAGPKTRRFHHSAGAVVLIDGRALLLCRRDREEWVLPKGHLKAGETAEDAARREVAEETGYEVRLLAPLGRTDYAFRVGGQVHHKWVDWFLAEPTGGGVHLEPFFASHRLDLEPVALRRISHADDRTVVERAFAAAREVPA